MAVYKRGNVWWYKFNWNGERIYESTKQRNKRIAEQIESARKTQLAKGEVGIRDRKPAPTLVAFAEERFLPFVRQTFEAKPKTVAYYEQGAKHLLANPSLAGCRLPEITAELISAHAAAQRKKLKVSSVNRQLQVLRRMFQLAMEWEAVDKLLPKVKLLPGENRRERVLTADEEHRYLDATEHVGREIVATYERALLGIRATHRGQKPTPPRDPYVLRDMAVTLLDCGMRPEECFRLRREYADDGVLTVPYGKTAKARRRIPLPERAKAIIESRLREHDSEWVFPAPTQSGHAEPSTVRDHHDKAIEYAEVEPFVLYDLRHTCLTRWSEHMDPYTLAYLAGHSDFATTKRYVHPQKETVRAAMERARKVRGGDRSGDTTKMKKAGDPA